MREPWSDLGGYGVDVVPIFVVLGPPRARAPAQAKGWRALPAGNLLRYAGTDGVANAFVAAT